MDVICVDVDVICVNVDVICVNVDVICVDVDVYLSVSIGPEYQISVSECARRTMPSDWQICVRVHCWSPIAHGNLHKFM